MQGGRALRQLEARGAGRRCAALALWLVAGAALGRTPPLVADPTEGVWLGAGEVYVQLSRDKWSVFPAGATVNRLAADRGVLWVATDDGAIRVDPGSRGAVRFGIDEGLPSQAVTSVAADEQFVWFATNKGLARYRKLDRTWRVLTEQDGLPHRAVNDVLVVGRKVWVATRGGLALYDAEVDGVRGFKGLEGDDLLELFPMGEDVWCRSEQGLTRFRPRTQGVTRFLLADLGGAAELRAWAVDGERLWVGTDKGLWTVETSSDTTVAFPQQSSLQSASIRGLELLSDYLFITTDAEVVQFHKVNKSLRRFTETEGLVMRAGVVGTAMSGDVLAVLFLDGAATWVAQRDLFQSRPLEVTRADARTRFRLFGQGNAEVPFDAVAGAFKDERFATALGGFGFSHRFDQGRTLELSGKLDYGQVELPGIRDVAARLDYQGAKDDPLREVRAEDSYQYRAREPGLERALVLRGGQARVASQGDEPKVSTTVGGGLRRGAVVRDFLSNLRQPVVPLSRRYILPGSEKVWVDGELLTNGVDYTVIYPAGQLAFLDLERVDNLSVVQVEYEVDLQPRKGLGVLSLLDLLPADKEVGDWTRAGAARLVSEETGLYAQIDGAAPRYIDRGWVKSVFVTYQQGGRTMNVAIHDLGSDSNANALFQFDLPPAREAIDGRQDVVLDLGLATSFAVRAVLGSYYLEASIDEKSDAARQSIKLFALQILDRGTGAGANRPGESPEWLAAWRVAAAPVSGLETGLRFERLVGTGEGPKRDLLIAAGDARYERAVGVQGLFTGFAELAASMSPTQPLRDGYAALAKLRLSHPYLEGALEYRHQSETYTPLGSGDTRFGRLADEVRLQATAYPARWLPATAFFLRSSSYTPDGQPGIEQQALARVQLTREGLPTASLQLGHTLLQQGGATTGRIKGVGQVEYDFAQGILSFLKLKRFAVRGLYSYSQANDSGGLREDQVQLIRLEGRLAPTATESGWILWRHRMAQGRPDVTEPKGVESLRWEVQAGARSSFIPGLIPQLSYAAYYDDDRVTQATSQRTGSGIVAGALGLQPGRWWAPLTPLMVEPRLSLANDEKASGELRTGRTRTLRFDDRVIWSGTGKLEVELVQLYEVAYADEALAVRSRKLDLRNRVTWRPRATVPLTARLNYTRQELANDLGLLPGAPPFGAQQTFEGVLEWLHRWSPLFTHRLRGIYSLGDTRDVVQPASTGLGGALQRFTQHQVGPELELRLTRTTDSSNLFLFQRSRVLGQLGEGQGAVQGVAMAFSLGAVWALGDHLYLDGEVAWLQSVCFSTPCTPTRTLLPRALLTFDL